MTFIQNTNLTCINQPKNGKATITFADAQALKSIYTGGANGSKVVGGITGFSTDTSNRDVMIGINVGGTISSGTVSGGVNYPLDTGTVDAGAGNSGAVPPASLMPANLALDSDAQAYFFLQAGEILWAQAQTTVTTAKQITVVAPSIGDF